MTTKIQELTEKIYNEGIVKAKIEADRIIDEAHKKAGEILQSAKINQLKIIEKANSEADELKKNAQTEIKLATRQFISNLKQQITTIITAKQLEAPLKETFKDTEFVKNLILKIVDRWNPKKGEPLDLKILISEKEESEFSEFLNKKAVESMNKGLNIQVDPKIKNGFKIGPSDGRYYISFTDADFENYFKSYFRGKTGKLLFED